jgi:hypothetical protein
MFALKIKTNKMAAAVHNPLLLKQLAIETASWSVMAVLIR